MGLKLSIDWSLFLLQCLNSSLHFLMDSDHLTAAAFPSLSLTLLRYAYESDVMCDNVTVDVETLAPAFLHGWFASRDVLEVMRVAIGGAARGRQTEHEHELFYGEEGEHIEENQRRKRDAHEHSRERSDNKNMRSFTVKYRTLSKDLKYPQLLESKNVHCKTHPDFVLKILSRNRFSFEYLRYG